MLTRNFRKFLVSGQFHIIKMKEDNLKKLSKLTETAETNALLGVCCFRFS